MINETVARKVLETVDAGLVKGLGKPQPGQMCVEAAVCYAMGLPHGDEPSCVSRAVRSLKIRLNDSNWSSPAARAKGLRRIAIAQLGTAGVIDDKEFARRVSEYAIQFAVPFALRTAASIQKDPHHAAALRDAALLCEKEPTAKNARAANVVARAAADADAADAAYADAADAYAAAAAAYAYAAAAYAAADAADADAAAAAAAAYAADAAYAAADAAYAAAADAADAAYADAARDTFLAQFAEGIVQILIEMKAPGTQFLYLTEV